MDPRNNALLGSSQLLRIQIVVLTCLPWCSTEATPTSTSPYARPLMTSRWQDSRETTALEFTSWRCRFRGGRSSSVHHGLASCDNNNIVSHSMIGASAVLWWLGITIVACQHGQYPVCGHCPIFCRTEAMHDGGKERRDNPTRLTGGPMHHCVKYCKHGLPNPQNHFPIPPLGDICPVS